MSFLKWMIHMFLTGSLIMSLSVACSPVEFNRNTNNCGGLGEQACQVNADPTYVDFNYPYTTEKPSVDVLIVVDSTESMKVEHDKIADRFGSFLNVIDDLEWRIAITTMDISNNYRNTGPTDQVLNSKSYTNSGYGYLQNYQDGNLIPFPSGQNYLDKSDSGSLSQKQADFETAIRIEDKTGDGDGGNNYFAGGDERGLFTASLSLRNNNSWLRSHAHLAVIFVTDEDVRSWGTQPDQKEKKQPIYEDTATHFREAIDASLGMNKAVTVYPIIVQSTNQSIPSIENGGTKNLSYIYSCLESQNRQDDVDAKVGYMYEDLFEYFEGTTASICNTNYSNVLYGIANVIDAKTRKSITLPCEPYIDVERGFDFNVSDLPNGTTWDRDGSIVSFEPALPPGHTFTLTYTCKDF